MYLKYPLKMAYCKELDLVQYIWEKLGPEYRAIVLQRRQVL